MNLFQSCVSSNLFGPVFGFELLNGLFTISGLSNGFGFYLDFDIIWPFERLG